MSDTEISQMSPRGADAKELYREMFSNPLRRNVQPNAGRVQQAGKESYCVWFLAREGDHVRVSFEDLEWEAAGVAFPLSGYVQAFREGSPSTFSFVDLPASLKVVTRAFWPWAESGREVQSESFVERANQLDKRGQTDAALDLVYDQVDALLRSGDLARIDALLERTDVRSLSRDLLLGLLTATLPARTRLASRKAFFNRVGTLLRQRVDWESGLLTGLES